MTVSRRAGIRLCLAWLAFAPIATITQVVFYAGPYRWLCEWQLDAHGQYEAALTAIIPTLILMAPGLAVLVRLQRGALAVPAKILSPEEAARVVTRFLGVAGSIAAVLCAGALAWSSQLPSGAEPPVRIDIARLGAAAPPLGSAILVGHLDTAHVVSKAGGSKSPRSMSTLYMPVVGEGATGGPVRFLVDLYTESSSNLDLTSIFAGERLKGVLIEGGLPHDMERALERQNLTLARPYYLLTTNADGARMDWYIGAGLSGFVAILCFALLGAVRVSAARAARGPTSRRRR